MIVMAYADRGDLHSIIKSSSKKGLEHEITVEWVHHLFQGLEVRASLCLLA